MSLSYDIMRVIVKSGSNLSLETIPSYDLLRELVEIAATTGSKITIPTNISYDLITELAQLGKGSITFIDKKPSL